MKELGVLLPIFSLPSKYGIGDFGYEAEKFIDILCENGITYWEILPINACNDLPYSPISYYALEEEYISLDRLKEEGLVENPIIIENEEKVQRNYKEKYYREAFSKFSMTEEYYKFKSNINLLNYAKYMKEHYNRDEEYIMFLQFILDKQWNEIRNYANKKNVKIVGDMPIYPAMDSADVESNLLCFELNNGNAEYIAGVPPDDFNPNGQKWGNPVYNFDYIRKNNYSYLIERYKEYIKRFDVVRIDHFRAYDSFFKIPVNGDAKNGVYEKGPGYEFFDELLKIANPENFWVEDLGDIRKETIALKEHYNFLGQNITIYSIDINGKKDTAYDDEKIVNYISNHDTDTAVGWYNNLSFFNKLKLKKYFNIYGSSSFKINESFIKYLLNTKSRISVFTVQDILGLDNNSRINRPGVESKDNWSWKLKSFDELEKKIKILNNIRKNEV